VVLIGPDDPNSFYINDKAKEMVDELNIPSGKWQLIAA
jgi:hypothetical protein